MLFHYYFDFTSSTSALLMTAEPDESYGDFEFRTDLLPLAPSADEEVHVKGEEKHVTMLHGEFLPRFLPLSSSDSRYGPDHRHTGRLGHLLIAWCRCRGSRQQGREFAGLGS